MTDAVIEAPPRAEPKHRTFTKSLACNVASTHSIDLYAEQLQDALQCGYEIEHHTQAAQYVFTVLVLRQ
jgi:hypothetical protein